MLASKRILKNYDTLLSLLKFSLKNSQNLEFKEFSLVESLLKLIKSLEISIRGLFNKNFSYKEAHYNKLLRSLFSTEYQKYKKYIDTNEKKELIRYFKLLLDLANFTIEKDEELEIDIIDKELRKIITFLEPVLIKLGMTNMSK